VVDNRDPADGPLVPVKRDPTYKRPVLETVEMEVSDLDMKYVKLVRRPSDDVPIFDIMFRKGLRLSVPIESGMAISEIGHSLQSQIVEYRPNSYLEYDDAFIAIIRLAEKTFGGSDGKVITYKFDSTMKAERETELKLRWAESMFFLWLKKNSLLERFPYELAVEGVQAHFGLISS
jgi:hypothetical protein